MNVLKLFAVAAMVVGLSACGLNFGTDCQIICF
jgi:outer membrane lipopolysaccharide assembly protein LptE/RlpB